MSTPSQTNSFTNTEHPSSMEDVHRTLDTRQIAINKVGIKDIRHPIGVVNRDGSVQNTVATFSMYVNLPHDQKGTHMSRFNAILNEQCNEINLQNFSLIIANMTRELEAESGYVNIKFPFFVRKAAPITGVKSMLDYEVEISGQWLNGRAELQLKVVVPVTSLCPCSKQISDYGAHNQRSHVTVSIKSRETVWIEDLIETIEKQASCEIFGLLKRADEKFVTETAYNNPKFVEDMVRDVANALNQDVRIDFYRVETENFESIHNHSAFAMIEKEK